LGPHRVLVCGGHDGTRALAEAEIFDQRANKWKVVQPMPTARSGLAGIGDGMATPMAPPPAPRHERYARSRPGMTRRVAGRRR
jgi:hypothetical protein